MQKHSDENVLECLGSSYFRERAGWTSAWGEVGWGQQGIMTAWSPTQEFSIFLVVNTGPEDVSQQEVQICSRNTMLATDGCWARWD